MPSRGWWTLISDASSQSDRETRGAREAVKFLSRNLIS